MATEVPKGSSGAAIIAEEERLYGQVQARVAMGEEDLGPRVGASDLDADLLSLRDQISEARAEDLPPLIEQMTRLAALKARLGGGPKKRTDADTGLTDNEERRALAANGRDGVGQHRKFGFAAHHRTWVAAR